MQAIKRQGSSCCLRAEADHHKEEEDSYRINIEQQKRQLQRTASFVLSAYDQLDSPNAIFSLLPSFLLAVPEV